MVRSCFKDYHIREDLLRRVKVIELIEEGIDGKEVSTGLKIEI